MRGAGILLAEFGAGLVLMVGFEHWLTRIVGLLCLFAFIITGVFLIADPRTLRDGDD
jgi:hypothetical protein